ncbi:MAG: hypothetical protein FJW40_03825 [Acidobacteria bacterium]|nr:hypothetical protein [Acidobacteriota bacterium]
MTSAAGLLLLAGVAGLDPRTKAEDYPSHGAMTGMAVGAEYLVHSLMHQGVSHFVPGYLVVEVGLYPVRGRPVAVNSGHFLLRVNGRKYAILSQPPGFVAASLKHGDWTRRPTFQAGGGLGDAGVILGRPPRTPRFPGDPTTRPLPPQPRAPAEEHQRLEKPERVSADEAVNDAALKEETTDGAVAGTLYFATDEKAGKIRKLELVYRRENREETLLLFERK